MYIYTYNTHTYTHTSCQERELTGSSVRRPRCVVGGVSCCPVTSAPPPRSVKASHILISADGKAYLSGLRSNLSMISHGQRQRVVHDFPKYSIKVLPWLSPEVLQQVCAGSQGAASPPPQDTPGKPPGTSWAGGGALRFRGEEAFRDGGYSVGGAAWAASWHGCYVPLADEVVPPLWGPKLCLFQLSFRNHPIL